METKENLTGKLKFIGLDLDNIPEKLKFFNNINFRVQKNYSEKNYKVYRYIDIQDIDIYLTPTNRLADYTEKCAKALPIGEYLSTNTDVEISRNLEFLNLIRTLQISDVEDIETRQANLAKNIPYTVQYNKDYLWQIYYSNISKKYFMLAPINESECSALFYVIKKQLENKSKKIYVPICYSNYSNTYLTDSEFEEIEKYLCYFTKDWPLVYEVYNKDEELSIQICGKTVLYDALKSSYKIELNNQGDAEDFCKLLRVLFILETQLVHHYKFDIKLDKRGKIHFYYDNREITYKVLISFIKQEYIKGLEETIKTKEDKINLQNRLKNLKKICKGLEEEYFEKEKQISTFLECKKTFLGRVKYFFKYKKKNIPTKAPNNSVKEEKNQLKYCERAELKDAYTLEELLVLYENLDKELNSVKDIELDIDALNKRIDIVKIKIENAKIYIKEIDEHKKSIFEFWKFTNKDDAKQLNQGTEQVVKSKKLKKVFNYELDFEDIAKQFDKTERTVFSKEDTDDIFIATKLTQDMNLVLNDEEVPEERFEELKSNLEKEGETTIFDIFGSMIDSKEKIKSLGNIKHRENEKNIYAILNIKKNTTFEQYKNNLKRPVENLVKHIQNFQTTIEIPIYKNGVFENGFNVFYINPENAIKQVTDKETDICKLVLKERTNCIPLTNIMYYNNTNQTLPLGMNVTDGILLNSKELNLRLINKQQNYFIKINDEGNPESIKINVSEYEIE